jgi:transcriptional regulator with XRE-family HTH domain
MNRNKLKNNYRPGSLHDTRSPRSVLLRMAADQERADRIRALKQERPDLTWRRIADHVGVTERAAADWQRKGGIEYDNAKKLAQLFEVDVDYVWRGTPEEERAPSPFDGQDALADRLDAIEHRVTQQLAAHAQAVEHLIAQQNQLLARQSDILDRIEAAVTQDGEVRDEIAELIQMRGREIVEGRPPASPSDPRPARPRPAGAKKPRAAKPRPR